MKKSIFNIGLTSLLRLIFLAQPEYVNHGDIVGVCQYCRYFIKEFNDCHIWYNYICGKNYYDYEEIISHMLNGGPVHIRHARTRYNECNDYRGIDKTIKGLSDRKIFIKNWKKALHTQGTGRWPFPHEHVESTGWKYKAGGHYDY